MQLLTLRVKGGFSNGISQKVVDFCLQIAMMCHFCEAQKMPTTANDSREEPASSNNFKDSKCDRPGDRCQGSTP